MSVIFDWPDAVASQYSTLIASIYAVIGVVMTITAAFHMRYGLSAEGVSRMVIGAIIAVFPFTLSPLISGVISALTNVDHSRMFIAVVFPLFIVVLFILVGGLMLLFYSAVRVMRLLERLYETVDHKLRARAPDGHAPRQVTTDDD